MQNGSMLRLRRKVSSEPLFRLGLLLGISLTLVAGGVTPTPAGAMEFSTGELKGTLDTTVTVGASFRVEERDPDLIAISNGGNAYSNNMDNGDLNYDVGDLVSASARVTHELDLNWRNYGFFGRMYYFYDWAIMQLDTERTELSRSAERYAGSNIKVLDAYLTGDFELWGRPITVRVGNQLLNWGESTFIQNGISVINPVDVSQLRVAGAELRDALLPVPMICMNANITENIALEGFYQFYWEKTDIEPEGTFFSTSDTASPGGREAFLGFGLAGAGRYPLLDYPTTPSGKSPPLGVGIFRGDDNKPSDQGEGGAALRFFLPDFNSTELGLFYIHYHSRLPVLSIRSGDAPPDDFVLQTLLFELPDLLGLPEIVSSTWDYASTAELIREYPEDIEKVGGSFNTSLPLGVALQAECSWTSGQPLQLDDVELTFASLSPMDATLEELLNISALLEPIEVPEMPYFGRSQLGSQPFNTYIRGWKRKDVIQPQFTLTKVFGPMLGWDQVAVVGEAGATYVLDMYDERDVEGKPLRYEGPGTFTSGNPWYEENLLNGETNPRDVPTTRKGFATDISWGYRLAFRWDFNNAIGPITLQPTVAFSHDVYGTTPSPLANFVQDRKAITAGLGMNYLSRVRANVSYTNYFDAGQANLLHDRDFASISASYSF